MMTDITQMQTQIGLNNLATKARDQGSSWFEAMAEAWGEALDNQATRLVDQAESLNQGNDTPSAVSAVTAESMRMQFLSNSSHTSLTAMGSALETIARKQ